MPQRKFRPSLTAAQIQKILALAKSESPISQGSLSLIASLSPFYAKIENKGIQPSYVQQRQTLMESLGEELSIHPGETKEEFWLRCYIKWKADPASCSVEEIQAAEEHRYLHDLMSPEQQAAFEARMFCIGD